MKRALSYLFSVGLVISFGQPAFSWGDMGHETVGEIAERHLSTKAKKFVRNIVGIEPLSLSATWPDKVRNDSRFTAKDYSKFRPYHFHEVVFGFEAPLQTSLVKKSADTILSKVPKLLLDPNVEIEVRQIWYRYFVHVVGDVHQPLHVGNGWDRGANLCKVHWLKTTPAKEKVPNLHSVWDSKIPDEFLSDFTAAGGRGWFGYYQLTNMLLEPIEDRNAQTTRQFNQEFTQDLINLPINGWYEESMNEHKNVYPDKTEVTHPKDRVYCTYIDPVTKEFSNDNFDEEKLPILDKEYIDTAKKIIRKRLILGGLRLAAQLNEMAKLASPELLSSKRESKLLQKAQLEN